MQTYLSRLCKDVHIIDTFNVGKFGCMWGTEDFLHWFQCVFNIWIFVINIQDSYASKYTTASFVNNCLKKGLRTLKKNLQMINTLI